MVRHDLGQVVLRRDAILEQVLDLRRGVRVRIRPPPEREVRFARADHRAKLPGMLDAARRPDVLVAAQHDERFEPVMSCAIPVGEAVLGGVLARQERNDV